jgi:hypothetical protein
MPAVPALVGESEILDVHGHWDFVRDYDRPHVDTTVAAGVWRYRALLEFSYILLVVHQHFAYEFDVKPTPAGGTDSEEFPYFTHQGARGLAVFRLD